MMLKRFGTFALLAVCLFAIVIVMGGCGGDDDNGDEEEIVGPPPPPPPPPPTPMEQLAGSYSLVERQITFDGEALEDPFVSGKMTLNPGGNGWVITLHGEDVDDVDEGSGPTWFATETTFSQFYDGGVWERDWILEENVLTLSHFDGALARIETWRKL